MAHRAPSTRRVVSLRGWRRRDPELRVVVGLDSRWRRIRRDDRREWQFAHALGNGVPNLWSEKQRPFVGCRVRHRARGEGLTAREPRRVAGSSLGACMMCGMHTAVLHCCRTARVRRTDEITPHQCQVGREHACQQCDEAAQHRRSSAWQRVDGEREAEISRRALPATLWARVGRRSSRAPGRTPRCLAGCRPGARSPHGRRGRRRRGA